MEKIYRIPYGRFTPAYLTGGTSATAVIGTWQVVADGEFAITIEGEAADVTAIDFTVGPVADMAAVAAYIQTAIRAVDTSAMADRPAMGFQRATVVWSTNHFVITSGYEGRLASTISVLSAVSGGGGTDISGVAATAFMDAETGKGTASNQVAGETGWPTYNDIAYFKDMSDSTAEFSILTSTGWSPYQSGTADFRSQTPKVFGSGNGQFVKVRVTKGYRLVASPVDHLDYFFLPEYGSDDL